DSQAAKTGDPGFRTNRWLPSYPGRSLADEDEITPIQAFNNKGAGFVIERDCQPTELSLRIATIAHSVRIVGCSCSCRPHASRASPNHLTRDDRAPLRHNRERWPPGHFRGTRLH